ncbi:11661_t:CDS:10 [Funneliformis geosporum]|uniref:11661_t:CDS:1 n=1 Tax=Funneliformis geosporum TaxID=1117311 RepID=A0A9W4SV28_9GLOM|nr:11661_t:CDS:10 [Funneliformis geosporum]
MGKYSKKREGTNNRQFTNVEKLKDNFFANSERRRKSGDKAHADFFNATAGISDDVEQIKLSANEQIFNQKKQTLITKIQGLIGKCQTSSTSSVAYVKLQRQLKEVENLTPKHQQDLLKLEVEAKQAESEYKENKAKADQETDPDKKAQFMILANKAAKKAEDIKRRIKVNPLADLSRFSNLDDLNILIGGNVPKNPPSSNRSSGSGGNSSSNTSNPFNQTSNNPENNKQLIFMATTNMTNDIKKTLGETTEQVENKIRETWNNYHPYYGELEPYQRGLILIALTAFLIFAIYYLTKSDKITKLDTIKSKNKKQQQILLLFLLVAGATYYFMVYLPDEEKKKKLEQQQANTNNKIVKAKTSALIGQYQKLASLFTDGDRNSKFYFSRAATYKIYFPPNLKECYEKGQESKDDIEAERNPTRGIIDKDSRGNNALFYGTEGTGKTATMKNLCVRANKYPLVEIKGSNLTPTELDQSSEILPLQKFAYTIIRECGFEREDNGEVRYILFVDEANQISNNSGFFQPNQLRFLKDCMEGVDKNDRNLFIENNPDAQIETEEDEKDEDGNPTGGKVKIDIEIAVKRRNIMSYDGSFESIKKETVEKVLDTRLSDVIEVINDKLNELIDEVNKSRIEGKEQIMDGIDNIIKNLANR